VTFALAGMPASATPAGWKKWAWEPVAKPGPGSWATTGRPKPRLYP